MVNNSGAGDSWRLPRRVAMLCLTLSVGVVGCGGGAAPVKGKVTYKGEPVKGGSLVFSPLAEGGKAASGDVKEDGTYTLTTNKPGDGAKPGHYRVTYTPPQPAEAAASGEKGARRPRRHRRPLI